MRLLPLLAAAALLSGCALGPPPAPPPAEIELRRTLDGRLLVDARIDGRGPFPFILDTGASVTLFDQGLADELGLVGLGREVTVHSVSGVTTASIYPAVTISLGEDAIAPPWIAVLDMPDREPARGVIGVDVLSQRVLEVDGRAEVVRLRREPYSPPHGAEVSQAELVVESHGLPLVEIGVNRERSLALVDTGLGGVIIVPELATRARVPSINEPVSLSDVMSEVTAIRRSGRATLRIGDARWRVSQAALHRPEVLDIIDEPAEAILGAIVFADTTLVIDFDANILYVVDTRAPNSVSIRTL